MRSGAARFRIKNSKARSLRHNFILASLLPLALKAMAKEIAKADLSQASSNGESLPSFEPDILAPHQYLKNCRRTNPAEPEKALMFAVLAEAVDTYQRFAFFDSPGGRLLFREAEA
jgi:hypothetical protein